MWHLLRRNSKVVKRGRYMNYEYMVLQDGAIYYGQCMIKGRILETADYPDAGRAESLIREMILDAAV